MDTRNVKGNETPEARSGSSNTRYSRIAKTAGIATAGSAAIAFLVAASVAPQMSAFSHSLAFSTSAVAAEAVSQPAGTMPSFADLVGKVKPAVVSIYVRSEETTPLTSWEGNGNNSGSQSGPFQFFFGGPGQKQFNFPNMQQTPHIVRAQGSGFFITGDGISSPTTTSSRMPRKSR